MNEPQPDEPAERSSVDLIAAALREKFGKDAVTIAARQVDRAGGDTRETWTQVLIELSRC